MSERIAPAASADAPASVSTPDTGTPGDRHPEVDSSTLDTSGWTVRCAGCGAVRPWANREHECPNPVPLDKALDTLMAASAQREAGNVEGVTAPMFLTVAVIAERLGIKPKTVRNYHTAAEQRRRAGTSRPGDFPPPDQRFGLTPVWKAATVRDWQRHRPGRGAGGGRPRKESA